MADGPAVVGPYSSESVEIGVKDGVASIANQRGWIGVGYDGSNYRFIATDSSGRQVFVGAGVAGTPAGGVLSVQGVSGGQALSISAASLPLPSGAATEATLVTLLTETTFTTRIPVLVTGGGTEATALRVTIANDSTGVLSVDDNGGSLTIDTTQLPAALVGGRLDANVGAWLGATTPTVGQKAMAASIPVVIASDQSAVPVSQSGTWTVQQGTPPWAVKGTDASGAAPTQNPVLVAGFDSTNVQRLLTDTSGRQQIVGAAATGAAAVGNPVQIAGKDSSGNLAVPLLDSFGGALTTIDWEHHKVHASKHFYIADWAAVSGAGTNYDLLLVTNGAFPHLTLDLGSQDAFTYELFEGTTTSADGTTVTPRNNNRNSATAAVMTAFHTPTVTATGTSIARRQLSSGFREGGVTSREHELILKTGTKYLLRFTKTDPGSGTVAWNINWYE